MPCKYLATKFIEKPVAFAQPPTKHPFTVVHPSVTPTDSVILAAIQTQPGNHHRCRWFNVLQMQATA